jgi:hypothetical protein
MKCPFESFLKVSWYDFQVVNFEFRKKLNEMKERPVPKSVILESLSVHRCILSLSQNHTTVLGDDANKFPLCITQSAHLLSKAVTHHCSNLSGYWFSGFKT